MNSGASGSSPRLVLPTVALVMAGIVLSAMAGPLKRFTDEAAAQLRDPQAYAPSVLGADPATGEVPRSTRPYRMPSPVPAPQAIADQEPQP